MRTPSGIAAPTTDGVSDGRAHVHADSRLASDTRPGAHIQAHTRHPSLVCAGMQPWDRA
jgi:hypothetical protein